MSIRPFQSDLVPIGHFDFLDSELPDVQGGEIVVFDELPTSVTDQRAPDVFDQVNRTLMRLATGLDTGPFFLAQVEDQKSFTSPGFELTSLFARNEEFGQTFDASGKIGLFGQEGFYSVNSEVVDSASVNTNTPVGARLYPSPLGQLTATPSAGGAIVGFFVEFRDGDSLRGFPNRFQFPGTHPEGDSIIVYKTNADGYINLDFMAQIIGTFGALGTPTDGYFNDGYFAFTATTTIADAVDDLNEAFQIIFGANGGSNILLGTPTDGYFTDGYVDTLTPATTIADAVDEINEALLDVSNAAAQAGIIGTPADGTYLDGFFPFTPATTTANAVDDINELLLAIAPAEPGFLGGTTLALSGTTLFSAILPSGLVAAWFTGGDSPGDTITSYIVDGTYLLDSPDQSTRFSGGFISAPAQQGTVTHVLNGSDGYAHDVTTGVGTTGNVTVDDISTFNTIWNKINAEIAVTQTAEGRETHAMRHDSISGITTTSEFFLDTVNTAPSFSVAPVATENTPVDGYLSGIIHYASGSTFDLAYTAATGIFNRAFHPTEVSRIEIPGSPNTAVNPGATPVFTDTFPVSAQTITLSTSNVARETPSATVRLFKPNGDTTSSSDALSRPVNTFGTASTATAESFVDEARRLTALASTSPDFTSSDLLTDGYAQVYISGSGGQVSFPRVADYPGFVAAEQTYQRHFTKASASSGTIVFGGFTVASIDPFGTGDTNVLLRLDTDALFFDAGLAFGASNGTGTGDSPANSIGCQVGTSSGSSLDFTFGVNSTATNGNQYRTQLIFRSTTDSITSLTTS